MKKVISFFLVAALCFGISACDNDDSALQSTGAENRTSQSSQSKIPVEDLYEYEEISGGLELTKYLGNEEVVIVPETIANKAVVSTGLAFSGNVVIKELILPESVFKVNVKGCKNLTKLVAPGVTEFFTIEDCKSLKYLDVSGTPDYNMIVNWDLPNTLETVIVKNAKNLWWDDYATESLKTLDLSNVSSIWLGAWESTEKLENVIISEDIKYFYVYDNPIDVVAALNTTCHGNEDAVTEITPENAAYVYCTFFCVDKITVNGKKYTWNK